MAIIQSPKSMICNQLLNSPPLPVILIPMMNSAVKRAVTKKGMSLKKKLEDFLLIDRIKTINAKKGINRKEYLTIMVAVVSAGSRFVIISKPLPPPNLNQGRKNATIIAIHKIARNIVLLLFIVSCFGENYVFFYRFQEKN